MGRDLIGMVGVANRKKGYGPENQRLLSTFANQIAVAIDNAMLHKHRQEMIVRLQQLHEHLSQAERDQLLALELARTAAGFRLDPGSSTQTAPLKGRQHEILRLVADGLSIGRSPVEFTSARTR